MNWSSVSTSTQPVWRDSAIHARSSPASEPVCDAAAASPCRVRPPFRMTTGFCAFAARSISNSRRPSLRRFDIEADHFRLRIGEIKFKQVGGRYIGAVADGDQSRKFDTAAQAAPDDIGAEPAALRNDADVADFSGADFGERDFAARRVDAETIRAEQAHAARARRCQQTRLQILAFIDFAEAARNDLRKPHASRGNRQHVGYLCRRHRDIGVIDRLRRCAQIRIRRQAVDRGCSRMYRIDFARCTQIRGCGG